MGGEGGRQLPDCGPQHTAAASLTNTPFLPYAHAPQILIEEIDPAESARQAAEEARVRAAKTAGQEAVGDALRRKHDAEVAAARAAVAAAQAKA